MFSSHRMRCARSGPWWPRARSSAPVIRCWCSSAPAPVWAVTPPALQSISTGPGQISTKSCSAICSPSTRGRDTAVAKRHRQGRCTARENIVELVDAGSFVELRCAGHRRPRPRPRCPRTAHAVLLRRNAARQWPPGCRARAPAPRRPARATWRLGNPSSPLPNECHCWTTAPKICSDSCGCPRCRIRPVRSVICAAPPGMTIRARG